jgi:hypothetical protein
MRREPRLSMKFVVEVQAALGFFAGLADVNFQVPPPLGIPHYRDTSDYRDTVIPHHRDTRVSPI